MGYLDELVNPANWDISPVWLDGAPQGYSEVDYIGDPVFVEAKKELLSLYAAQHRMHLTAIAVGGLCGLAGFVVGWLVFAC